MIARLTTWIATIALATAACGGGGPELAGTWEGEGPQGGSATWEFGGDGSLVWDIEGAPEGMFEGLHYEVVSSGDPMEFDITGFEEGPMSGQTLYCIGAFPGPDTLRIDCEPGTSEDGDGADRPTEFGENALELTRAGADAGE